MDIIRKTVPFEIKAITEDDYFFFFEGYASTFGNADYYDDVMVKGAFVGSLVKRMPKLLWQHRMDEPVGIYESAMEDDHGLFVKGKMPKAYTFVMGRVMPQMKVGSVADMSIGFSISDYDKDIEIKDGIRFISKVELWESSLVTIPANDQANVLAIKSAIDAHLKKVDSKAISYDQLKELDERTLEGLFKSGVSFESKAAKTLISIIKESNLRDAADDSNRDGDNGDWGDVLKELDETNKSINGGKEQ